MSGGIDERRVFMNGEIRISPVDEFRSAPADAAGMETEYSRARNADADGAAVGDVK